MPKFEFDAGSIIALAAVGLGLYWLFRENSTVQKVRDDVGEFLVSFRGTPARVTGQVILAPTNELISVQEIVEAGSSIDSANRFKWQGTTYQISGRDGDYYRAAPTGTGFPS